MQKFKNIEMEQMVKALEPLLGRTDMIGYAAARNTRILNDEMTEYLTRRDELVRKYGDPETDENGNLTGLHRLFIGSENWKAYESEITEWALIEHEPNLMKIKAEDVIGKLSGTEILRIDWMIKEDN